MSGKKKRNEILYLSFNKDKTCLSLGMQLGYRIYDVTKKDSLYYYERIFDKGIGIIEMLEKTNILGLVGGGDEPLDLLTKLKIYDDKRGKKIADLNFKRNILNIRIKKDKILVICENYIYLIETMNFKSIDIISLGYEKQKHIVFAYTLDSRICKLAYFVYIEKNEKKDDNKILLNTYNHENSKNILEINMDSKCFISCLEFNNEGKILAVSHKYCDYIGLYSANDGKLLCKCYMNSSNLNPLYLTFNSNDEFLSLSLDTGEIVIFKIKQVKDIIDNNLQQNYIEEKIWSKFYLPEKKVICTFGDNGIGKEYIICIGSKGNYYLIKFDYENRSSLAHKIDEKYFLKLYN